MLIKQTILCWSSIKSTSVLSDRVIFCPKLIVGIFFKSANPEIPYLINSEENERKHLETMPDKGIRDDE
jgi:hypothetical protein